MRNQIVILCRESKRLHFQNYFLCHANNIKNTWQGVNQIININSKSNKRPSSLIEIKKLISDPYKVASSFNEYFSTIADKYQTTVYHLRTGFSEYFTNANEHNIFIKTTNPIEIINIINNLAMQHS